MKSRLFAIAGIGLFMIALVGCAPQPKPKQPSLTACPSNEAFLEFKLNCKVLTEQQEVSFSAGKTSYRDIVDIKSGYFLTNEGEGIITYSIKDGEVFEINPKDKKFFQGEVPSFKNINLANKSN
ncbi:MAG: hypothetical protein ACRCXZ_07775 [Patescibacteria group bacterium]